jgi:hypothetical protein
MQSNGTQDNSFPNTNHKHDAYSDEFCFQSAMQPPSDQEVYHSFERLDFFEVAIHAFSMPS